MPSLSTQFFATIDELSSFIQRWIVTERIHAAAVAYQPFSASRITQDNAEAIVNLEQVQRVVFCERPIDFAAESNTQLLEKNPSALVLNVGRVGPRGLMESSLGTLDATATWRRIAADLKRNSFAGMIGEDEPSGATAKYRTMRYTAGAARLEKSGTPLRPFEQSPVRLYPDK